jgi:predicted transposase/invertase (TIGR01784 family)
MADAVGERRRWTLDPRVDLVFSLLFGAEQNRRLLIALLNDVLRPTTAIESVEVLPSRPEASEVQEKAVFLDLRVRLESGEQVDVEMQTQRHVALRPRVLFYWGRLYTGQLLRGEPYSGLQRCAVVLIADFVELAAASFHSVFQARERSTGELLTDHLELHVLELPKLQGALVGMDEPALAAWCRFLAAETDEQLEALAMQYPILKEAKDALEKLSADPEARERAERREIELKLYEYGAATIRAEGRTEGRLEGRAEGKQQTFLRLAALKFGELPSEVQARAAIATEHDLDLWLERLLFAKTLEAVFARG